MTDRWPPRLDHLVYGVPDLADGVAELAALTGVAPVRGGRHEGRGTANFLVGLGPSCYLEIIGPDPDAKEPPTWFGLGALQTPRLLTWAVRTTDLDASVQAARAAGYDPGAPAAMSRRTDTGDLLRWRLTPDTVEASGGIVPFLLDWGSTAHPAERLDDGRPGLVPVSLTVASPTPAGTMEVLRRLDVSAEVEAADRPGLRCVVDAPSGRVVLA